MLDKIERTIYENITSLKHGIAPGSAVLFLPEKESLLRNGDFKDIVTRIEHQIQSNSDRCANRFRLHITVVPTHDPVMAWQLVARMVNVGSFGQRNYVSADVRGGSSFVYPFVKKLFDIGSLDNSPVEVVCHQQDMSDFATRDCCPEDYSTLGAVINRIEPSRSEAKESREDDMYNCSVPMESLDCIEDSAECIESTESPFNSVPKQASRQSHGSFWGRMGRALFKKQSDAEAESAQIVIEEENSVVNAAEREKQLFIDRVTALILDYVTRCGEMPPMDELTEVVTGKLMLGHQNLSRIVVNKDRRIVLPEYNEMELPFGPIQKTIYILFLRHPEGITMRDFPDCRDELRRIYLLEVKPTRDDQVIERILDKLCDPFDTSSLREKLSCINRIVKSKILNESLAKQYVIAGRRGEEYRVNIDSSMVQFM